LLFFLVAGSFLSRFQPVQDVLPGVAFIGYFIQSDGRFDGFTLSEEKFADGMTFRIVKPEGKQFFSHAGGIGIFVVPPFSHFCANHVYQLPAIFCGVIVYLEHGALRTPVGWGWR
jgi:hypothetical protein